MSMESGPRPQSTQKSETKEPLSVDDLLATFPPELQDVWSKKIENLDDEQALAALSAAIEKRKGASKISSEKLEHGFEPTSKERIRIAQEIEEVVRTRGIQIGIGSVGRVVATPTNPEVCYKVVHDHAQYSLANSVAQEASLLDEANGFSSHGVRVPRAYHTIATKDFIALGMERLPGMSLEDMLKRSVRPHNLDSEAFFAAMHKYIDALAETHHIYHGDLSRPGNYMFDEKTGGMFVVDFGRAAIGFPDQEGFVHYSRKGESIRVRDTSHEDIERARAVFNRHSWDK